MNNLRINTVLSDGTRILIRRMQPKDKNDIVELFQALSPRSRYLRYGSAGVKLKADELDKMTSSDTVNCQTLGVYSLEDHDPKLLGLAEFLQCDEEQSAAEFAIVIIDEYQNRGVGSLLLDIFMILVRRSGFSSLSAYLMRENIGMIRLIKKLNPSVQYLGDDMIKFDISLAAENSIQKVVGMNCQYNGNSDKINYTLVHA